MKALVPGFLHLLVAHVEVEKVWKGSARPRALARAVRAAQHTLEYTPMSDLFEQCKRPELEVPTSMYLIFPRQKLALDREMPQATRFPGTDV